MAQPKASTSTPMQWKHAVAGSAAGLATQMILHPLDVVKTRLQVQDGAGLLPAYRGTLDALHQMVRQEGWRVLYSGLTPALVGSGLAWGIYFWAYNRAKGRYQRASGHTRLSPGLHLVSAAEAGALVCFVTNPIWVVKTRLQLQRRTLQQAATAAASAAPGTAAAAAAAAAGAGSRAATQLAEVAAAAGGLPRQLLGSPVAEQACVVEYRGFVHAFVQIARCEGLPGLYKGLLPSLLLVSHGAIQFAVYEELKTLAQGLSGFTRSLDGMAASRGRGGGGRPAAAGTRQLSPVEITACGALSKLAASVTTYPSQARSNLSPVIRSRLQQRMDSRALQYSGVGDVVRKTLQREGLGGFYKGLAPNVLRVMPQSALTFLVYESVMRLLDPRLAQQAR